MASKEKFSYFLSKGYPVDTNEYDKYDALESNNDLNALFELLMEFKDKNNRPAVITANVNVANPDFEAIRRDQYQKYHYELFTETLKRYPKHDQVAELYFQGMHSQVFKPQLHNREHINVKKWMTFLRQGHSLYREIFDHHMYSLTSSTVEVHSDSSLYALDAQVESDLSSLEDIIFDGADLFEQLFGYRSKSFIAPRYTWHPKLEKAFKKAGISYLQGRLTQTVPNLESDEPLFKRKWHYQGQKNRYGQRYLVRNVYFEPSMDEKKDWVSDALNRIEIAFRWSKPAIIGTHRLNYIGFLDESNRTRNLGYLRELLNATQKKWPEVEFMTSDELGDMMVASK